MRAKISIAFLLLVSLATSAQASVEINASPTKNMNCTGGICTPTAKKAVLNTTDLANMLATGDVKVVTGNGAVTITVSGPFSWTSTHRLTLDAYQTVSFKAPVEVAGTGAVTVKYNDGGTGGDLIFFNGGKLEFWDIKSKLFINNNRYRLAQSIKQIREQIRRRTQFIALANSLDLSGIVYSWSPIADVYGVVEGLGNTISNLTITAPPENRDNFGLVRTLHQSAQIRNIELLSVNLNIAFGNSIGALVGEEDSNAVVANSYVTGQLVANGESIGGLVGLSYGIITRSRAAVAISTSLWADVGGLAGGVIGSCYAPPCKSQIDRSFAAGSVSAGYENGGLVGAAISTAISDSYATGGATGTVKANFGGLVGWKGDGGSLENSYSTGAVAGGTDAVVGGSVADDEGGTNNSIYWDLDTSGIGDPSQGAGNVANDPGLTGLTDTQLKSGLPAGFDPTIWAENPTINNGYPYLIANPPPQ